MAAQGKSAARLGAEVVSVNGDVEEILRISRALKVQRDE